MLENIIVHIGTEKTGTTAIQEFLYVNREALRGLGYAYLNSPGRSDSRNIATLCTDEDIVADEIAKCGLPDHAQRKSWRGSVVSEFTSELQSLQESVHTVIISSEHFHSRLISKESVARLHRLLSDHFRQIKIVVYLRRQDQLAVSLHSTALRVGWSEWEVFPPVDIADPYLNYWNLLTTWCAIFGEDNVTPRVFEPARFVGGNLIVDFLQACGIEGNADLFDAPLRRNESMAAYVMELMRQFNRYAPRMVNDVPSGVNAFREFLCCELEKMHPGRPALPAREAAQRFYRQWATYNARTAQRWFGGTLFDEDFTAYPVQPSTVQLSAEEVLKDLAIILTKFFEHR